jgi:hypothetical protein
MFLLFFLLECQQFSPPKIICLEALRLCLCDESIPNFIKEKAPIQMGMGRGKKKKKKN